MGHKKKKRSREPESEPDATASAPPSGDHPVIGPTDVLADFNAKLFDIAQTGMIAAGALFAAMATAGSVPEAMARQADHLRRGAAAFAAHAHDLADLAERVADDAAQTIKAASPPESRDR